MVSCFPTPVLFGAALLVALGLCPAAQAESRSNRWLSFGPAGWSNMDFRLADLTGDGFDEWVGIWENFYSPAGSQARVSVGTTGSDARKLGDIHVASVEDTDGRADFVTGHFRSTEREDVLLFGPGPVLRLLTLNVEGQRLDVVKAGPTPHDSGKMAVGDFDGDGYDEIAVHRPWRSELELYEYEEVTGSLLPMAQVDLGHLADPALLKDSELWVGNFGDFAGEGRRDDLLFFVRGTNQIVRLDSRLDSAGNTTFWWAFTLYGWSSAPADQVRLGDIDGDGFEDLALHDSSSGALRFHSLDATRIAEGTSSLTTSHGQLPEAAAGHLMFGRLADFPDELTSRDDVVWLQSDPDLRTTGILSTYHARLWDGSPTYWWSHTLHPATLSANIGLPWPAP